MVDQRNRTILALGGFFASIMHHDTSYRGLICLIKKRKICFWILESNFGKLNCKSKKIWTENDFLLILLGNQQTLKTFERLSFYLIFKSKQHSIDQWISNHSYTKQFQDLRDQAAFHFTKNSEIFERRQMVWKCPWKDSRKFGNCRVSEKQTIQPKIPKNFKIKIKCNGSYHEKIFENLVTSRDFPLSWKLCC